MENYGKWQRSAQITCAIINTHSKKRVTEKSLIGEPPKKEKRVLEICIRVAKRLKLKVIGA